jgi:hypothetical protein
VLLGDLAPGTNPRHEVTPPSSPSAVRRKPPPHRPCSVSGGDARGSASRVAEVHRQTRPTLVLHVGAAKHPVTFRRTVLDEAAPDVALLTYGKPLLDQVLAETGATTDDLAVSEGAPVCTLNDLEQRLQRESEN